MKPDDAPVMHECWSCGVRFWITPRLDSCRRQDKGNFFCPNGHSAAYTKSEADKVRDELAAMRRDRDRLAQNGAYLESVAEDRRREAIALRGQLTKVRKRVANGVCPCCNRTFANLARHMAAKHKDLAADPPVERVLQ